MTLSHLDASGRVRMVDVGGKPVTARRAVAIGEVRMSQAAFVLVLDAAAAKGDVLTVAEVAGVMAAKRTSELVPLCHPVALDQVEVRAEPVQEWPGVLVTATVCAEARTGVEMEALVAVSTACLTVYDMVKSADRGAWMTGIRVLEKAGGVRGEWIASMPPDPRKEHG
jgi:cyclic pyranopterin phosphate synthase